MMGIGIFSFQSTGVPQFNASNFSEMRENQYFPLRPGNTYFYESMTDEGLETSVFMVTHQTKTILGVPTTVIHDMEFLNGELVEDTFDWYAADRHGNVWYFGEDTREIEDGEVVSTSGSWQAGQNGALPGVIMLANPQVGIEYAEENRPGQAEDRARVVALNRTVKASSKWPHVTTQWPLIWSVFSPPSRTFRNVVRTRNTNPLDPGVVEWKYYAPGIGAVLEVQRDEDGEVIRKRLVNLTTS
jgi:hypothetical protein